MKKIGNKIRFFFDTLVKSLTKFKYYNEILKAKFSFSLKYLFFLFYLLSLITGIVFAGSVSILVIPNIPTFIRTVEAKASSFYPDTLVVNIKNGIVSTNVKEPYYVDTLSSLGVNKGFDHFITIDTKASPSEIKDDKTMILVTKDSFVTIDNSSSYRVYQIDPSTNFTLDKKSYNAFLSKVLPYLRYLQPALVILVILVLLVWPIIGGAIALLFELIYLLIFTAIFYLPAKLMKKKIGFKKLYQLAMHAASLPILLGFVVTTIGIPMPFLLGSLILFIFMILVVNNLS